jgi:hypothetical protein
MQIPLGIGAYSRSYGRLPEIRMENRFFEENPVGAEKVALLSRPGSRLFLEVGDGPIRTLFTQPGVLGGDLFIVSGGKLYRYDGTAVTPIDGDVPGPGYPVMAGLAIPGWDAVFITDGATLQYYEGASRSTGTLSVTVGGIVDADVVRIGDVYYAWASGDVDDGSPDGTSLAPWLVKLGASDADSLSNLFNAINHEGLPGIHYSTDAEAHPTVSAFGLGAGELSVRANAGGAEWNAVVTSTTSAAVAWGAATLQDGGGHELKPCEVPDDILISDIATLASHVICVESESRRFFWIRPGEVNIDALDYSSMESEPDFILNVVTVGDQFWLFGQASTESWYASGDGEQPFLRTQGRAFSQGIIPGSLARVQESIVAVGQDMVVYRIAGAPQRISNHGIEEKIRLWQESL